MFGGSLQKQITNTTNLMLKFGWISRMHRNDAAVHVQLPNDGTASLQLWSERLVRTLAKSQQSDQDVLFWVFIRQESFPTSVGDVVSPYQFSLQANKTASELKACHENCFMTLSQMTTTEFARIFVHFTHLIRPHFVVNFLNSNFSGSHVSALRAQILHTSQRQLPQIAVLHSRTDQRHRDVPEKANLWQFGATNVDTDSLPFEVPPSFAHSRTDL